MNEFLNKYVYITVQKSEVNPDGNSDEPKKLMQHKCALVTTISKTHISLFDTYDDKPYMYRIVDVVEIKLSNKDPGEMRNG